MNSISLAAVRGGTQWAETVVWLVVARTDLLSAKVFVLLLFLVVVPGMPAMIRGLICDYRPCSDASVQTTI